MNATKKELLAALSDHSLTLKDFKLLIQMSVWDDKEKQAAIAAILGCKDNSQSVWGYLAYLIPIETLTKSQKAELLGVIAGKPVYTSTDMDRLEKAVEFIEDVATTV